ncbi:GNAT family N-acetyltransferase [Winogradskyella sp. UBA3174]|uniref:GNAT family N-acetyltransferase n=1 Tax=Winogradskyella sp. UBA3174 TaxID=1947785 RepID=UPI0025D8835D|nr:GNAT family N-acetyltransferase [Winogradskyella sp. UBA3174]|tara:strand:+ start:2471 stop:2998 length:528 start_codon:yes stop_codon:yes gene_type:complete
MKLIRLKNISDNYFQKAWNLYEDAFPFEERRLLDNQSYVLQNDRYHFDILIDKNQFMGFILWWDFETHRYIDHFATSVEQRNRGIGKFILNNLIDSNDKPVILEVELPTSTINERRIKFYERLGFKLNQHYYEIPPLKEDQSPLQLLLMSYPSMISEKDVDQFVKKYHPVIFKNK